MVAVEGLRREDERRKQEAEAERLAQERQNTGANWAKAVAQIITGDEIAIRSVIAGDTKSLLANADSADTAQLILHMTIFMAFIAAGQAGTSAGARSGMSGGRGTGVSARGMPEDVYAEAEQRGTPIQRSARTDAMLQDLTTEYSQLSPIEQHRTSIRVLYHRMQYHLELADEAFAERDMSRYELERSTANVFDTARRRHAEDLNQIKVDARLKTQAERAEISRRTDTYLKERESVHGLNPFYLNEIEIRAEKFRGRQWETEAEFRRSVDEYIEFRIRYNTYIRQCEALDVEPKTLGDYYRENDYTEPKDYNDFLRWSSDRMLDDLEAKRKAEANAVEEESLANVNEETPLIETEDAELDEYHRANPARRQELLQRKAHVQKFLEAYEKYRLSLAVAGTASAVPFASADDTTVPDIHYDDDVSDLETEPDIDSEPEKELQILPEIRSVNTDLPEERPVSDMPVLVYSDAEMNLDNYNFVY